MKKKNKKVKEPEKKLPRILNLGCGNIHLPKEEGWINIDMDKTCNPDVVRNLEKGLPFDTNSVEGLYSANTIEHISDIFFFMYEIWRVCKPNVVVEIIAPLYDHPNAIWPNHVRYIRPNYFYMWIPKKRLGTMVMNYETETMGAEFETISESIINEGTAIRFFLQVVK